MGYAYTRRVPKAEVKLEGGPREKLDAAVIATRPTRRYRAAAFQAYVLGASAVFIGLAVVAHFVAYFPIDLTITHAVQSYHGAFFDRLMYWVSWLGFMPQVDVLIALTVVFLFLAGLRWEAVAALFAACAVGIGTLVKLVVFRPRPTADLVHVFSELPSSGFPSGHVLEFTAFCGFFGFLVYTLLKPSWGRTALLVGFLLFIVLMGLSNLPGQHWFSGDGRLSAWQPVAHLRFHNPSLPMGKPRFFRPSACRHPDPCRPCSAPSRRGALTMASHSSPLSPLAAARCCAIAPGRIASIAAGAGGSRAARALWSYRSRHHLLCARRARAAAGARQNDAAMMTQTGAIEMIGHQRFGRALLVAVAVGLAGYSLGGVIRAWFSIRSIKAARPRRLREAQVSLRAHWPMRVSSSPRSVPYGHAGARRQALRLDHGVARKAIRCVAPRHHRRVLDRGRRHRRNRTRMAGQLQGRSRSRARGTGRASMGDASPALRHRVARGRVHHHRDVAGWSRAPYQSARHRRHGRRTARARASRSAACSSPRRGWACRIWRVLRDVRPLDADTHLRARAGPNSFF